jgi:acetoin utilization protein AcuB
VRSKVGVGELLSKAVEFKKEVEMFVEMYMSKDVITVSPDKPIMEVGEIMNRNNVRRLPVVKRGKLTGIVARSDIREAGPSDATSLSIWEVNYLLAKTTVEEIMTKDVLTVSPDNTIEEAALLLRENKVGALPVMEDGKLVGIITESDIFDALIEVMGVKWGGTRISLELEDRPGALIEALEPIKEHRINIISVATCKTYCSEAGKKEVIVRMEARDVDGIIFELKNHGIKVSDVR